MAAMPECFVAPPHVADSFTTGLPRPRRKLLAYGDSLTAGRSWRTKTSIVPGFVPYGQALAAALSEEFDAEVWCCGLSGVTAREMVEQLQQDIVRDATGRDGMGLGRLLTQANVHQCPFDLVLIMAGSNDLMDGHSADAVLGSIRSLHCACHDAGVQTVAMSVPPSKHVDQRWQEVNAGMARWADQGVVSLHVDTGELVPLPLEEHSPEARKRRHRERLAGLRNASLEDVELFWDPDFLHFAPEGSKRLGRSLAPLVAPLLRNAAASPETPTCSG